MRLAVDAVRTELILGTGRHVPAKLLNISSTGFLADCSAHAPVGSAIYLRVSRLQTLIATIRWRHASLLGCEFAGEPTRADLLALALHARIKIAHAAG